MPFYAKKFSSLTFLEDWLSDCTETFLPFFSWQTLLIKIRQTSSEQEMTGSLHILKTKKSEKAVWRIISSVGDPNPDVFGPPGSGSMSQMYGSTEDSVHVGKFYEKNMGKKS